MKVLTRHAFDGDRCRRQLNEFERLLTSRSSLDERKDILPFFMDRHDISILISEYFPAVGSPDVIAHEYPIYGHFRADLLIGDSVRHQYLLVEFENGTTKSIFRKISNKATVEWSPRFEHDFSQLVDWLWVLEDMRSTADFSHVFGSRNAKFHGLLVLGRGAMLNSREKARLEWRMDRVVVDSHKLSCVTFDQLYEDLNFWLSKLYAK
jgi:hypothetical protein